VPTVEIQCAQYLIIACAILRDSNPGCARHALLCKRCLESSFQIHHDTRVSFIGPGSYALYLATTLTHHSIVCAWLANPYLQIIDRHVNYRSNPEFDEFYETHHHLPLPIGRSDRRQLLQPAISGDLLSWYTGPACRLECNNLRSLHPG
jgi:hypothetical protein